jgi:hypothetical protein
MSYLADQIKLPPDPPKRVDTTKVHHALIDEACFENDLNKALRSMMDPAGIKTGDIAAQYFDEHFWRNAYYIDRLERVHQWLRYEKECAEAVFGKEIQF